MPYKSKESVLRWRAENHERYAASTRRAAKRFHERHPDWKANNARLRKYGLTSEAYEDMKTQQGGVCACCGDPPKGRALHVDHDHQTGAVRQLLCARCNSAIGVLEHDLFATWMDYLDKHAG
jgi:hypothetical protein